MEIQVTTRIFKEGRTFVAHALELDVSSCGGTKEKALKNLKEAVRLFLEEAENMGTLEVRVTDRTHPSEPRPYPEKNPGVSHTQPRPPISLIRPYGTMPETQPELQKSVDILYVSTPIWPRRRNPSDLPVGRLPQRHDSALS